MKLIFAIIVLFHSQLLLSQDVNLSFPEAQKTLSKLIQTRVELFQLLRECISKAVITQQVNICHDKFEALDKPAVEQSVLSGWFKNES